MFKKAKLYSLLAIIVASTVVSLFSFMKPAYAACPAGENCATWGYQDGASNDTITYNGKDTDGNDVSGSYDKLTSLFQLSIEPGDAYCNASGTPGGTYFKVPDNVYVRHYPNTKGGYNTSIIFFDDDVKGQDAKMEAKKVKLITTFQANGATVICGPGGATPILFDSGKTTAANDADFTPDTEEEKNKGTPSSSCQIKGIGWFVCPVVVFLGAVTDGSYMLLNNTFLKLEPIALPGGGRSNGLELYNSWKMMRDFANIVFIIGFLIIVFSQITSIGIGNYGIKRLLPKIIIAAILVNLSYYICVVAVDLSNITGNALRGLFDAAPTESSGVGPFSGHFNFIDKDKNKVPVDSWEDLISLVIGGAGVGIAVAGSGALLFALFPVLLPMVVSAAVAVFTVVIALTIRQALIVILVIISPLAFVALLLPNTEDYFKKWRSLFTAMLLVYPIISVIFGASGLASRILMATDDFPVQIVGAGVSIIPLFITPIVMKVSGGLLSRIVGVVNDPSKGWVDSKRNALAEQGNIIATNRKARGVRRMGNWVSGTSGSRFLGGANSRQRNALALFSGYSEKVRKDNLSAAESGVEGEYLRTAGGQMARAKAKNAQKSTENATINAETVRLSTADGITLQEQAATADTAKLLAETRAQTAGISAIAPALGAAVRQAELEKKTVENEAQTATTRYLSGSAADRGKRRSELELKAAETGSDADWAGQTIDDAALSDLTQEVQTNQTAAGVAQGVAGRRFNESMADGTTGVAAIENALNVRSMSLGSAGEVGKAIETAATEAEEKELRRAIQPLQQELAEERAAGRDPDAFLQARAQDTSRSSFDRDAAMHEAARLGRDGVLRDLQTALPRAEQGRIQQAISSNASALLGKAPDLVKGRDAAFNSATGEQIASFGPRTMEAYISHVAAEITAGRLGVANAFNAAINDIQSDTTLQTRFDGAAGQRLRNRGLALASADPAVATQIGASLGAIQADGKIR